MALGPWLTEVNEVICASLAPSTQRGYSRKVTEFAEFRQAAGLPIQWPAPVEHLLFFLLHLQRSGRAVSSLPGFMSAIAFVSKAGGYPDFTQDFRVRRMLEGFARKTPPVRDQRRPITPELLGGIAGTFSTLCSSPCEVQLFRAALLTAFFGAFRPSEFLAKNKTDQSARALRRADLTWMPGGVLINLRWSKTDQRGIGCSVTLKEVVGMPLCPVAALREYTAFSGEHSGALFQHEDGSPLTLFQFRAIFSRALGALGLQPREFGLHSLRIGAASAAAALGLSGEDIQNIGHWRSSTYRRYVRK
ncbi:integrase/recombinase xerD homolog [Tiliqua scincoides]|uniref:integrase/recombinase xerD homolog n=1 Tax=Tiliqua scincoides TaxID=71010 RepID=UPI0034620115